MATFTHLFVFMAVATLLVVLAPQGQKAQADNAQLLAAAAPFSSHAHIIPPAPAPAPINCTAACGFRCSKAGHPNSCLRACGTCCHRCNCVPPGTSGNQEACGTCYSKQKTHDSEFKCP